MADKKEIKVHIEPHFAGRYRLEYDGKYITLFGRNNKYPVMMYGCSDEEAARRDTEYDETVLIPIVVEARKANPEIVDVTQDEIIIHY